MGPERVSLKTRIVIAIGQRLGAFPSVGSSGEIDDRSAAMIDESIRRRMDWEMDEALGEVKDSHQGDLEPGEELSLLARTERDRTREAELERTRWDDGVW